MMSETVRLIADEPDVPVGDAAPVAAATPARSAAEPAAEETLPAPLIKGYIEVVRESTVGGWAWCQAYPDRTLQVEVHIDGVPVRRVPADRLRPDLLRAGFGNGRHGFVVHLDQPIADGERDRVTAFVVIDGSDTKVPLRNYIRKASAVAAAQTPYTRAGVITASTPSRQLADLLKQQTDLRTALVGLASELKRIGGDRPSLDPAAAAALVKATEHLQAVQECLVQQATQLEIIETRLDIAVAAVKERTLAAQGGRSGSGLYWAVSALAVLSFVSLAVGLYSILT